MHICQPLVVLAGVEDCSTGTRNSGGAEADSKVLNIGIELREWAGVVGRMGTCFWMQPGNK